MTRSAEGCCRQALARFMVGHCAAPAHRTEHRTSDTAYRAPAPCGFDTLERLHPEGCESGRIGTIGNRVWGNSPWVQIPPSPLKKCRSAAPYPRVVRLPAASTE